MNCPRCHSIVLTERDRDGMLVDVCGACRGVWLDRGELEKLIARAAREFDAVSMRRDDTPPRGVRYYGHAPDEHRPYAKKKRGWIDTLEDIFD